MFVVITVDYGDTCDGHSRKLGTFKTKAEAELAMKRDMAALAAHYTAQGVSVDWRKSARELWVDGEVGESGSVWDIHEI